jgi:hypothetical protein
MKPTWIMVYNILLNFVCKYFIENFCICVHQGNGSIIFFFCYWCSSLKIW